MEKLYTVEVIANMLSLTTRTIRNYLKDGILKGRKIGGQWRFTEDDLKNFMDNPTFAQDSIDKHRQDVLDFVDGVYTDSEGAFQTCTVIDIYEEHSLAMIRRDKILEWINTRAPVPSETKHSNYVRFTWEYIESEEKARITMFASPENLIEALNILK